MGVGGGGECVGKRGNQNLATATKTKIAECVRKTALADNDCLLRKYSLFHNTKIGICVLCTVYFRFEVRSTCVSGHVSDIISSGEGVSAMTTLKQIQLTSI